MNEAKAVLALMDEVELRHGVHEDRWNILRNLLEQDRRPTQRAVDETYCACKDEAFINDETPGCCGNCGKPFRH